MNRRGFLGLIGTALASPLISRMPVPQPAPLQFHPQAFAMVMEPLDRVADVGTCNFVLNNHPDTVDTQLTAELQTVTHVGFL
jgi:hypothetical protein